MKTDLIEIINELDNVKDEKIIKMITLFVLGLIE